MTKLCWIGKRKKKNSKTDEKISENKAEGKELKLKKAMSECRKHSSNQGNQEVVAFRFFPLSEPLNLRLRY